MRLQPIPVLSLAALLVLPSVASSKVERPFESEIESVQVSGQVEVPLYAVPGFTGVPVVAAEIGGKRFFLAVDPVSPAITLTDAAAGKAGLEVKKKKDAPTGEVEVETIQVGDLSLTNTLIQVGGNATPSRDAGAPALGPEQALSLDGTIGLGKLPAAVAVVPSEGVVRFAPAGTALLADGEALTVAFERPGMEIKLGKRSNRKLISRSRKKWVTPGTGFNAEIGGKPGTVAFTDLSSPSKATTNAVVDPTTTWTHSGSRHTTLTVSIGGTDVMVDAVIKAQKDLDAQYELPEDYALADVVLGRDVLMNFDYAAGATTLTLRPATKNGRVSAVPLMLADAEAALKEAMEAPTDAEAEVKDGVTLPKGNAGAWKAVAKAREAALDFDGALEAWENVARFQPNGCQGWLDYGARVAEYSDNPLAARPALTKSAAQYHTWWDLDPEVRDAFSKILEDASEAGQDYFYNPEDLDFVVVDDIREKDVAMGAPAPKMPESGALVMRQPASCQSADGQLARLDMLEGKLDAVVARYNDTFDLDSYMADIAGAAQIVLGDAAAAQEPLRQAVLLEWSGGAFGHRRAALAQVYIAAGDRQTADELLTRAVEVQPSDLAIYDEWAENAAELYDERALLGAAKAFSDRHPNLAAAHLTWWRLAKEAGRNGQVTAAKTRAEAALATARVHRKDQITTLVDGARAALLAGEVNTAQRLAERATKRNPGEGMGWMLAAEVAQANGDAAAAEGFRKRAAQASTTVVYYSEALADGE